MREFATCEGICRERKLELVSGGDCDEVVTAAAACRARVRGVWPIVEDLAAAAPRQVDWEAGYESLRERTRLVVRESGPDPGGAFDEAAWSAETTVVWRCPDCGGLEAPEPCIGVCIWRPLEWVEAGVFETERARALRDIELERSLLGLLTRFARVTPREGEWERNWRVFQGHARRLLKSHSGSVPGGIVSGRRRLGV